jgi:hypothetical protein
MKFPSRFGIAVACSASSLLILAFDCGAYAADRNQPARPSQWTALDNCAAYGPDFTSVEGTQSCVKIGGHVRVEYGSRHYGRVVQQEWGQGGASQAAMRTETPVDGDETGYPYGHHLRLRQDADPVYGDYLH